MVTVRLARMAMASRFEMILEGDDEIRLRAAGEEALSEIERLDTQLSTYRSMSDINRINARAASGPIPVEPRLFFLLQLAERLYRVTNGAFDITIGPLMQCWGFVRGTGQVPDPETLAEARGKTGMHLVRLNEEDRTIEFARPGVRLDLGAIGKGYAIDEAVLILREAGVTSAFIHGGTSTMYAMGKPQENDAWKVAIRYPDADEADRSQESIMAVVALENEALSVSAVSGKSFEVDGTEYGHVLDPRTGWPTSGAVQTAVALPSATESDALSTGLLVLAREGMELLLDYNETIRAMVVYPQEGTSPYEVIQRGIPLN